MKTFNVKTFFLTVITSLFLFSSCKKNNEEILVAQPTIEGTWAGKYGAGNNVPDNYFSFIINKDGTLKVKTDASKEPNGTGTWKMDGGTFTAIYQYTGLAIKYNVAAKTDIAKGTMDGSYGIGEVSADDGTYFMTRQ
ncbi:MAG: hypothetical protein WKF35_00810 [Ferruginibacter sp.]